MRSTREVSGIKKPGAARAPGTVQQAGALRGLAYESGYFRTYRFAPAPAREYAIVAAVRGRVMPFARRRDAAAQIVSRACLPLARKVLQLALSGQQRYAPAGTRIDGLAVHLRQSERQL